MKVRMTSVIKAAAIMRMPAQARIRFMRESPFVIDQAVFIIIQKQRFEKGQEQGKRTLCKKERGSV